MMDVDNKQLNVIFMGHFSYPEGHASTKRVQNTIQGLHLAGHAKISVLVLRQGRQRLGNSPLCGVHQDIPYATIGQGIVPGISVLWKAVRYYYEGRKYLKESFRPKMKNIVYVYGPPSLDNCFFVKQAHRLGYKVVFDIVEDVFFQSSSKDVFARLKHLSAKYYFGQIDKLADGILVISTHLMNVVKERVENHNKIMHFPINLYIPVEPEGLAFSSPVTRIFYGGTFGEKDGVENLITAFDVLAGRYDSLELILTGQGSPERMKIINQQVEDSKHAENIQLKGYLQEKEYQQVLAESDIYCMVRTDSAFANAGFPFKLGEYLATGKPVVASNIKDVGFYLKDRESAILVEPGSVDSIIEALEYLISHPHQAQEMGLRGKEVAQMHFEMHLLTKRIIPFLEKLSQTG